MSMNKNTIDPQDPYFDTMKANTTISFDVVLWLYRILKYWYLFVISIFLCVGIAYLKNKSWVPSYVSQAMLMLESRGGASVVNAVQQATLLRSNTNQQILLKSYGMTERTVKSLPKRMRIDYYRQDYFRRLSIYGESPVEVDIISNTNEVYGYAFNVAPIDDTRCRIYYDGDEKNGMPGYSIEAIYGEEIVDQRFQIKMNKTRKYVEEFEPFTFSFLSEGQLIGMYHERMISGMQGGVESSALTIMLPGNDINRDIDYFNVLLDEFQSYNLDLKNSEADLTIDFLDKQLSIINDSLLASRTALDTFQKKTGVYEIDASNTLRTEIDEAEKLKRTLFVNERTLLIFAEKINESILGDSKLIAPEELNISGGELSSLVSKYNEVIEKAKFMGAKSPMYSKTSEELNSLRANILKELQRGLNNLQDEKDALIESYKLLFLKVDNLPPQERDLIKFQREYNVNEIYHQFLTQKKYEAEIQRASNTPDNFIWEHPRGLGGVNNGGERSKTYMFWLMLGGILPLLFVVLKEEVFNYTIATKEECEKISGLPVLGTIENISSKLKSGVVLVKNYPKSSFAESFRNIRVRLEYIAQRQNNISVLVTSAEPADGKTFIATNIASVYQLMHKKVILVDLDLRRPSVAKTLQLENLNTGISNYLVGQVELEDIITTHPEFGFDIIPAGTLPPNPSELIKTAKTKELIQFLKTKYDYVVIDCSPVGLVSDAYILAPQVDTTLFAVRRGKTSKSFFKSVVNQMKFDGIQNIGLVFNDVKGREGYYGTSRYYGDKTYYLRKNSYYHDDYFEN